MQLPNILNAMKMILGACEQCLYNLFCAYILYHIVILCKVTYSEFPPTFFQKMFMEQNRAFVNCKFIVTDCHCSNVSNKRVNFSTEI